MQSDRGDHSRLLIRWTWDTRQLREKTKEFYQHRLPRDTESEIWKAIFRTEWTAAVALSDIWKLVLALLFEFLTYCSSRRRRASSCFDREIERCYTAVLSHCYDSLSDDWLTGDIHRTIGKHLSCLLVERTDAERLFRLRSVRFWRDH